MFPFVFVNPSFTVNVGVVVDDVVCFFFPPIDRLVAYTSSFLPFCLSFCPFARKKKNEIKLAITFKWSVIQLSYFTCVFLGVRPFLWYQGQDHLPRSRSNIKVTLSAKNSCCCDIRVSQTHLVFFLLFFVSRNMEMQMSNQDLK